jgi:hypothetical protein
VLGSRHVSYFEAKGAGFGAGRESGQPVGFTEREETLGLVCPAVHGLGGHGLAADDSVVVTGRADLRPLSRVSRPGRIGQGRVQVTRTRVLHGERCARCLGLPELLVSRLSPAQQLVEVGSQSHVGEVVRVSSGTYLGTAPFHVA